MHSIEIKPGQIVTYRERRYSVIDKHPKRGHWWLQDEETGEVSVDLYAPGSDLRFEDDPNRPETVGRILGRDHEWASVVVRASQGDWFAHLNPKSPREYFITHAPTGAKLPQVFAINLGKVRDLLDDLAGIGPLPSWEAAQEKVREIAAVCERY